MADREVSWASLTDRDRASTTGPPPIVCTHTDVELVGAEIGCRRGHRAGWRGWVRWQAASQGMTTHPWMRETKKMVVDGTDLQGNDGMWQSAQMTGPFLRRAFTEMPCAPVAWTMLALALLWLGRFLWRRYWTVAIHVDSNGEITDIEPIGRGAATLYKREGIERLESFANSELPPSDPKVQA